jgi:hypothetical protein
MADEATEKLGLVYLGTDKKKHSTQVSGGCPSDCLLNKSVPFFGHLFRPEPEKFTTAIPLDFRVMDFSGFQGQVLPFAYLD